MNHSDVPFRHLITSGLLFCSALMTSACGGSGSGSNTPALPAPQQLQATADHSEVTLDWDTVDDATGYNLYLRSGSPPDINNPAAGDGALIMDVTPPHTIEGLDNHTTYYFLVTATAAPEKESQPSAVVTATPAPGVSGHTVTTRSETLAADSYAVFSVNCSGADRAVAGGGVRVTGGNASDATLRIQEAYPSYTSPVGAGPEERTYSWRTGVANIGDTALSLEIHAVCMDRPEGYTYISETHLSVPGSDEILSMQCDEGLSILGGGPRFPGNSSNGNPPGTLLALSQPTNALDGWEIMVNNASGSLRQTQVIGVCAPPLRGLNRTLSADTSVSGNNHKEVSAGCNADQKVLSGGYFRSGSPDTPDLLMQQSFADVSAGNQGWHANLFNVTLASRDVAGFVLCADAD